MIQNNDDAPLHELTFLTGLANYYLGHADNAMLYFKTAFFSAHSIESSYATTIQYYLLNTLGIYLFDETLKIKEIPLIPYEIKKAIDTSNFTDGTYDLFSPETLTLGGLIRELRTEQGISQQMLCTGLCSKSKLSKIENGTLQPDVTLSQSLLQRLGISDTVFTFYGSEHEASLHELRQKLTLIRSSDTASIQNYTEQMLRLCDNDDTFYIQYATYKKATYISDKEKSAEALLQSLYITLPNFTLSSISSYRLSWLELTILNNYCNAYRQYSPAKGTLELYKLLKYYEASHLDILEKRRLFHISLCYLSAVLHKQNRFLELVELSPYISSPGIKCSLHSVGVIYGNYSQALGEIQQFTKVPLVAAYAYYNLLITNSTANADSLKNSIYTDFHISLL